jgi:hypothetical protein
LTQVKAPLPAVGMLGASQKELSPMYTIGDFVFLGIVVFALVAFAATLAFAERQTNGRL